MFVGFKAKGSGFRACGVGCVGFKGSDLGFGVFVGHAVASVPKHSKNILGFNVGFGFLCSLGIINRVHKLVRHEDHFET